MPFNKAKPQQAALKIAIFGQPGSGKTFSTLLFAEGLAKLEKKRIAYVDTERGTDFYAKRVPSRKVHPEAFDFDAIYTRELSTMLREVKALDAKTYGVVVIDSMTHVWEAARESYRGDKGAKGEIPMWAWSAIKAPYKDLVNVLLSSPFHVFILGREGNEFEEDSDGKIHQVGKKMKAEGETAYEPNILMRMNAAPVVVEGRGGKTKVQKGTAKVITLFVEKDRTGVLDGRVFERPTYESVIQPLIPLLDREGGQAKIQTSAEAATADSSLFEGEDVDKEQASLGILTRFKASISSAGTLEVLERVGKDLAAEKAAMTPAHVAAATRLYKERKAELDPAKRISKERDDLVASINGTWSDWDEGSVERFKATHLFGRKPASLTECSLVELRTLKAACDAWLAANTAPGEAAAQ